MTVGPGVESDRPSPPRVRRPILVIVGPTGVGKTGVALRVAREIGGEIVGCDALQLYRGFDIGTAKPTPVERQVVPHHLVDSVAPDRDYTAADYVREADAAIAAVAGRGHVPVVVGGTGMYLRALLRGLVSAPPRDAELRSRLRAAVARFGPERLHARLERCDPDSASRIRPADVQRLVRAIEIALGGGPRWSERLEREGTWSGGGGERYAALKVLLDRPREQLARELERRIDRFFTDGWVDEVRGLLASVRRDANAFKAIGYREIAEALDRGADPADTRDRIVVATRRFAKRQRTWFRGEKGLVRVDASDPSRAVDRIVGEWRALERSHA